jgi:hypothetical protein
VYEKTFSLDSFFYEIHKHNNYINVLPKQNLLLSQMKINRGQGRLSEKISLLKHQSKIVKSKIFLGNLWCPIQSVADYLKGRLSEGNLWCPRIERR